jgi:hypothetical protein
MARELKELGILKDRILLEEESTSTRTEVVELIKFSRAHKWKRVVVLTSDYHIPRTKALYEGLERYITEKDNLSVEEILAFRKNTDVTFVSAEEILSLNDPGFAEMVSNLHKTPEYQNRVKSEQEGLEQLKKQDLEAYQNRWDPKNV